MRPVCKVTMPNLKSPRALLHDPEQLGRSHSKLERRLVTLYSGYPRAGKMVLHFTSSIPARSICSPKTLFAISSASEELPTNVLRVLGIDLDLASLPDQVPLPCDPSLAGFIPVRADDRTKAFALRTKTRWRLPIQGTAKAAANRVPQTEMHCESAKRIPAIREGQWCQR